MTQAFLPPPAFFTRKKNSGSAKTAVEGPVRRTRPVARTNPFDDDFFISKDDLKSSAPKQPPSPALSNMTVAERRRELNRQQAESAASKTAPGEDDDEKRRSQMAGEEISAADLFGVADMVETGSGPQNPINSGIIDPNSSSSKVLFDQASTGMPPSKVPARTAHKRKGTKKRQEPVPTLSNSIAPSATSVSSEGVSTTSSEARQSSQPSTPKLPPLLKSGMIFHTGDLVQHQRHGVGKFSGLERTSSSPGVRDDAPSKPIQEYVVVEYRDGDVYVPISHLELLRKLSKDEVSKVEKLDVISGSSSYRNQRGRTTKSNYLARRKTRTKIRKQLVNLHGMYAERTTLQRPPFPACKDEEEKFYEHCEFELTRDQKAASEQVLSDMSDRETPMDRLLCGDVGFGKTEVAIRAAFRALLAGKQIALLSPTTILAQQHCETFQKRIEKLYPEYPVVSLTRFLPRKEIIKNKEAIRTGEARVAIGTHMILGDQVSFLNLGLLIIDEEHRFGVNQKEKIRARYRGIDTLFLSATPIPRTLHLTLSGLRDASVLSTPPDGRKPVVTKVSPSGAGVIRRAIGHECDRNGQVFFVVPRIESIEATANWIRDLFPDLRVLVAHGAMNDLEHRIWSFAQRQHDVLVCTTIIENGINMPEVNTIIVQDAGRFGLAQLHQLRGRVGRSDVQAFAWLLYSQQGHQTSLAYDRLKALEKYSDLGSGFAIAQKDMEMRGVGTVLGIEQHGNSTIDAEEYSRMLGEELEFARTGKPIPIYLPTTDRIEVFLPVASIIPEDYISDFDQKMAAYSLLSNAKNMKDLKKVVGELRMRYGPLPTEAKQHVSILILKLLGLALGISRIMAERQHVVLDWALEDAAFKRLVAFLPDEQSRNRCEAQFPEGRVVIRGLAICSGDVQVAKLRSFLDCFAKASAGFAKGNTAGDDIHLVKTLTGLQT